VNREKRQHFRLNIELPCALRLPNGDTLTARILNLSAGGLMLRCGRDTLYRILPRDQRTPGQVTGVMTRISFDLQPPSLPPLSVDATARLIHSERLAQDVFHVGVQFTRLDGVATESLITSIEAYRAQQKN
jgi:c-di-GMP-binding flagellar brake protein YcgR